TVSNLVFDSATGAGSFDVTFSDGPATSTVSIEVQDCDGAASNVSSISVDRSDVRRVVTDSGSGSANEGDTKHYTFTTTDPTTDTFSVVANSGASVGTVSNLVFDSATGAGSFDVTFNDGPALSTVSIQVQDSDGAASNVSSISVD